MAPCAGRFSRLRGETDRDSSWDTDSELLLSMNMMVIMGSYFTMERGGNAPVAAYSVSYPLILSLHTFEEQFPRLQRSLSDII